MYIRIQKFLRDAGLGSRRHVEDLILSKKIKVNDKFAIIGQTIDLKKDKVYFENKLLKFEDKKYYMILNKPKNFVVSKKDNLNREIVYDLFPEKFHFLNYAGRLDKNTEGLLIFSNDGDFLENITHPKYMIQKEYFTIIDGVLQKDIKEKIEKGGKLGLIEISPCNINIKQIKNNQTLLYITINEGQNREIKRIFNSFGFQVIYLQRIRIGKLRLSDLNLKKGEFMFVKKTFLYSKVF